MNAIKDRMQRLSDEDLMHLIDNEKEDYTQQALDIAQKELQARGGRKHITSIIEAQKEQASDSESSGDRQISSDPEPGPAPDILVTTETALGDLNISERIDIVTAEVAIGINVFKDFMASATDIIGGRNGTIQKSLAKAKQTVMAEIKQNASDINANAIVGLRLEYNEISSGRSMLLLVAVGTAVKLEPSNAQ